jgi:hypothetical protein
VGWKTVRQAGRRAGRQKGEQVGRQEGRRAGMQACRQTEVQKDGCTDTHTNCTSSKIYATILCIDLLLNFNLHNKKFPKNRHCPLLSPKCSVYF